MIAISRLWVNISGFPDPSHMPFPPKWLLQHWTLTGPFTTKVKQRKRAIFSLWVFLLKGGGGEGISLHLIALNRVNAPQLICEEGWMEHLDVLASKSRRQVQPEETTKKVALTLSLLIDHLRIQAERNLKTTFEFSIQVDSSLNCTPALNSFFSQILTVSINCFGST